MEVLRITVDLGEGKEPDHIIVNKGQENQARQLARDFCRKHGFDSKICDALYGQIQENIELVNQQMEVVELEDAEPDRHNFVNYQSTQQQKLSQMLISPGAVEDLDHERKKQARRLKGKSVSTDMTSYAAAPKIREQPVYSYD